MKKVIAFILVFVLTFGLFGCELKDKSNPQISNPDAVLAKLGEYSVTNREVYNYLKAQYGATAIINLVDNKLLAEELAAVAEEDVKAAIDKDCYGEEELSETEKAEKEQKFLDNMFISYSCIETDIYGKSIMAQYALSLAQKAYAQKALAKEVEEHDAKYAEFKNLSEEEQEKILEEYENLTDEEKAETEKPVSAPYFADSKYSAKYAEDNYSEYKAIVVPFDSAREVAIALSQKGIKVNENGVWANENGALTNAEVYAKFLELYKDVYAEDYKDEFVKAEVINKINASVVTYLTDNMEKYSADSENAKWYTPKAFVAGAGNKYVLILKLDEKLVDSFEDLTDEQKDAARKQYTEELIEDTVTATYALTKVAELRNEKGLVIYDSVVENGYINNLTSLSVSFEKTKDESANLVAKYEGGEVTADQLFDFLITHQGASGIIEKLAEKKLLTDEETNPYYVNGEWKDAEMKKKVEDAIETEKKNFKNGNYVKQGYDPASMAWELYIKAAFNVENEEELKDALLLELVSIEYAKSINVVGYLQDKEFVTSDADVKESVVWKALSAAMEAKAAKLFKADVCQLIIAKYDAEGNQVDPAEWSSELTAAANELATQVVNYVKESTGTYTSRLKKVSEAFAYAPSVNAPAQFNGQEVALTLVSENGKATVELSKFKELGLTVAYYNNGTISNETKESIYVNEPITAKIKEIWDQDLEKQVIGSSDINDVDKVTLVETAVVSKYGYHVLVNLESLQVTYAHMETTSTGDTTTKKYTYIPTLEEIRKYLKNSKDSSLTQSVIDSITKYYTPVANELTGEYFALVMKYAAITKDMSTYSCEKVSKDSILKYAELFNEYSFEEVLEEVTSEYVYVK